MGGLIARDLIAKHSQELGTHKIVGLITLGTPHLGYPYASVDETLMCPQLVQDMAGSWYPNHSPQDEAFSPYLLDLTQQWAASSFAGYWLAAAGTSCSNPVRTTGSFDARGCLTTSPRSDGVVCRDSAVYSGGYASGTGPTVRWEDPDHNYVHTFSGGGWGTALILCGNTNDANQQSELYQPPAEGLLFAQIKAIINGN